MAMTLGTLSIFTKKNTAKPYLFLVIDKNNFLEKI